MLVELLPVFQFQMVSFDGGWLVVLKLPTFSSRNFTLIFLHRVQNGYVSLMFRSFMRLCDDRGTH